MKSKSFLKQTAFSTLVLISHFFVSQSVFASSTESLKTYSFKFKTLSSPIQVRGASEEAAYKLASKECFQKLTQGVYPGEEKGLEYIDICANPKTEIL